MVLSRHGGHAAPLHPPPREKTAARHQHPAAPTSLPLLIMLRPHSSSTSSGGAACRRPILGTGACTHLQERAVGGGGGGEGCARWQVRLGAACSSKPHTCGHRLILCVRQSRGEEQRALVLSKLVAQAVLSPRAGRGQPVFRKVGQRLHLHLAAHAVGRADAPHLHPLVCRRRCVGRRRLGGAGCHEPPARRRRCQAPRRRGPPSGAPACRQCGSLAGRVGPAAGAGRTSERSRLCGVHGPCSPSASVYRESQSLSRNALYMPEAGTVCLRMHSRSSAERCPPALCCLVNCAFLL